MAVIHDESCFEKNAFEDTENPTPAHQNSTSGERYRKISFIVLKLFLRPILFHGKLSFDNLTCFKLYGNLKTLKISASNVVNMFLSIIVGNYCAVVITIRTN